MCSRKLSRLLFTIVLLSTTLIGSVSSTSAFITRSKWQTGYPQYYSIDGNLDAALSRYGSISGSVDLMAYNAVPQWNNTRFGLTRTAPFTRSGNYITSANFQTDNLGRCGYMSGVDDSPAATCIWPPPYQAYPNIETAEQFFNSSPSYAWNTSGTFCESCYPRQVDVLTVGVHELGHWLSLDHDGSHPEAVMYPDYTNKQYLRQDDLSGATQIYGPRTGWETGSAIGDVNTMAYGKDVSGYGISYPELGPRTAEFNVTPYGNVMDVLAGNSTSAYSYAYMRLFSSANDNGFQGNWLDIKPGMKLKWLQYNYQQRSMSIDFRMTDGSTLRDSGLVDQNGVRVHPALRYNYPARQWLYFEVDLTPLAGKRINEWYIAYDNSQTQWAYLFRAYFDNVRVEY